MFLSLIRLLLPSPTARTPTRSTASTGITTTGNRADLSNHRISSKSCRLRTTIINRSGIQSVKRSTIGHRTTRINGITTVFQLRTAKKQCHLLISTRNHVSHQICTIRRLDTDILPRRTGTTVDYTSLDARVGCRCARSSSNT